MLGSTSVMGAALISWGGSDGVARLKSKREQPPRPLIKSSGNDPISTLGTAPDCGQLWIGYASGRIVVYTYATGSAGKIQFHRAPSSTLLAHKSAVRVIALSCAFAVAASGDSSGVVVLWDLYGLSYVRSIICPDAYPVTLLTISETLGDLAIVHDTSRKRERNAEMRNSSELRVFTVNARPVGCVCSVNKITGLCYSNAPEGVSVNVIATGLENGVIRCDSNLGGKCCPRLGPNYCAPFTNSL